MKFQISTAAAALGFVLLASSCYPYQEGPPPRRRPENHQQQPPQTPAEQQKQKDQRERAKADQEQKRRQQEEENPTAGGRNTGDPGPTIPTTPPSEPKPRIPVATKAPGREGYVLSPFNSRLIDVRGIPSGTLVADPTFPESDKKHFRVP